MSSVCVALSYQLFEEDVENNCKTKDKDEEDQ